MDLLEPVILYASIIIAAIYLIIYLIELKEYMSIFKLTIYDKIKLVFFGMDHWLENYEGKETAKIKKLRKLYEQRLFLTYASIGIVLILFIMVSIT